MFNLVVLKKKHVFIPLVFIVVIVLGILFLYIRSHNKVPVFESIKAVRKDIVSEVSITGRVEPINRVALSFLSSGRIKGLLVKEGDEVRAGTTLAYLDSAALDATIEQSRAALLQQQQILAEVKKGNSSESVAVSRASVDQANIALDSAIDALHKEIERTYVVAHTTINENADRLFKNTDGSSPEFGITFAYGSVNYAITTSNQTRLTLDEMRSNINERFKLWQGLSLDERRPIQARTQDALDNLSYVQNFLTTLSGVLNRYVAVSTTDSAVYAPFQTSVAGARSTISSLITELLASRQAYEAKETALAVALRQYDLAKADPTQEAVGAQEAAVAQAALSAHALEAQLPYASIVAPIDGVVTAITMKEGETVSPGVPILSLISQGTFELDVYVPEADIANVHVGQEAEVTFDALGSDVTMHAKVINIDPGETMQEGVATYKTVLYLDTVNPKLLSGMSADINITTDSRSNVIAVPNRSVVRDNGREYVQLYQDGGFVERDVKTGLRGSDGSIEILSGLQEGDDVVLYID